MELHELFSKKVVELGKANQIPFKNYVFSAIGANLVILAVVALSLKYLPPQVPLFYGLPQSEDQLVPSWALIVPPAVSILIILANVSFSLLVFKNDFAKDEFLKKTLILGGLLVSVFSIVTTIKIILLVGSF